MRTALIALASLATLACTSSTDNNPPSGSDVVIVSGAASKGANAYDPHTFHYSFTNASSNNVIWRNGDGTTHTVTADDGLFDSGNIAAGGSFSYAFPGTGIFPYHCKIHPTMTGIIDVNL